LGATLARLHSGSWIESTFRIWIGDPVKNQAWARLGRTRARVAEAERRDPGAPGVAVARRMCLAAEGSDWFWWYGEPFSSAEDGVFDELFRAHLEAAWRALGEEPPVDILAPLVAGGPAAGPAVPGGTIHPHVDGKADRFYEWHGAVTFDVGRGGAMADSGHPIEKVLVGFDEEHLYLRIVPTRRDRRLAAACHLTLTYAAGDGAEQTLAILTGAPDGGPELRARGGRIGALHVVELALPLAAIGARPRDELRLGLRFELAGTTFARVPRDGVITVVVPWPGFDLENWTA
jgi:hypothetical protein